MNTRRYLGPNEHSTHALPAESVFVSVFTALGAEKYLYCEGSTLDPAKLQPMFFGKKGHGDIVARYQVMDGDKRFLPPPNLHELIKKGEALAIPVPGETPDAPPKGYLLVQRPLTNDLEEDPTIEIPFNDMDKDIATFIVNSNARFITASAANPARMATATEQINFMKGLNERFSKAIAKKHPVTDEHVQNVTRLARALAIEMNESPQLPFEITADNLELFTQLVALHDIGKYQIPNKLLNDDSIKRNVIAHKRLTSSPGQPIDEPIDESKLLQWEIVKKHVNDSRDIIDVPLIDRELSIIVSSHHMQPCGGEGYPYTLGSGYDRHGRISFRGILLPTEVQKTRDPATVRMPIESGLMRICDQFEAITGTRQLQAPHRKKPSPAEALKIMRIMALNQEIDPYLFNIFAHSSALEEYCRDPKNVHLDQTEEEKGRLKAAIQTIDEDAKLQGLPTLQSLVARYEPFEEGYLFNIKRDKGRMTDHFVGGSDQPDRGGRGAWH